MHAKKTGKLLLDVVMVMLLAVTMSSRITGETAHERLGIILLVLFVVHNIVNRHWFKGLLKGRYNYIRLCGGLINLLLIVCVLAVALTGILTTKAFFPNAAGQAARQVHSLAAHWMLILVGLHLGLHWGTILTSMFKALKADDRNLIYKTVLRIGVILIVIGGVKASFAKDVGAKLIMYFSFSFWDRNEPAPLFMLDYLLVLALYACLAYYVFKTLKMFHKAKKHGCR